MKYSWKTYMEISYMQFSTWNPCGGNMGNSFMEIPCGIHL
jgi:hypothetical protein